MYTHGGGCHGALGFELAFQYAGFRTEWLFDNNQYCQALARRHMPNARQLGDMIDIHNPPYVDVFTAGFPCQPFSSAGLMRGADDPRYLLGQIIRIISEVKPRVILLENVPDFATIDDGYHFKLLLREIARMGYDAEWGSIRASDVGSPQKRKRWCLVAYTKIFERFYLCREPGQVQVQNRKRQKGAAHIAVRARSHTRGKSTERFMGGKINGLSFRMDTARWPAAPHEKAYSHEPTRITKISSENTKRLQLLGNAIVPQAFFPLAVAIREWLVDQDRRK
jgi:DNA-cytosine methyltransferase